MKKHAVFPPFGSAALAVSACLCLLRPAAGEQVDANLFAYSATITFKGYEGVTLTNFPAMVRVGPNTISGFECSQCAQGGGDVVFADADGTILDSDLDEWNDDSSDTPSIFWVKIPRLRPGAAIKVYWSSDDLAFERNSAAVWDAFTGVWHLGEPSFTQSATVCRNSTVHGSALDAHPTGEHAQSHSLSTPGAAGRGRHAAMAVGQDHDGRKSCLEVRNFDEVVRLNGLFTVSGWFMQTQEDESGIFASRLISRKTAYTGSNAGWEIAPVLGDHTRIDAFGRNQTSLRPVDPPVSFNLRSGWMHICVAYSNNAATVYLNGTPVETALYDKLEPAADGTAFGGATDNGSSLLFGAMPVGPGHYFIGDMDEIRLAAATAAADLPTPERVRADYDTVMASDFASYSRAIHKSTDRTVRRTDFRRVATLTFKGYEEGALIDFPALVKVGPQTIRGFDYADCAADGSDIRFVLPNGEVVAHEIDTWNAGTGGDSLIWVRVPRIVPGASVNLFWGVKAGRSPYRQASINVWSRYAGVWHFGEANGTCTNSSFTGTAMNAVPGGKDATELCVAKEGRIGRSRQLQGAAYVNPGDSAAGPYSWLEVENYDRMALGSTFAFSAWYKVTGSHGVQAARLASRKHAVSGSSSGWEIALNNGSTTSLQVYGSTKESLTTFDSSESAPFDLNGSWTHVFAVFSGDALAVYMNGRLAHTVPTGFAPATDSGFNLRIGGLNINNVQDAFGFIGEIDEMRLYDIVSAPPDALRARAEYETVATDDFIAYSEAQKIGGLVISFR